MVHVAKTKPEKKALQLYLHRPKLVKGEGV